jgi:3-hydroxyisobutyrate dehydrogenase-like beta-hydroxyacid dehydrogenase
MSINVGFIGLGIMGMPMILNLAEGGYPCRSATDRPKRRRRLSLPEHGCGLPLGKRPAQPI